MNPSFEEFLKRLDQFSEQFRELKEGVHKAIDIADRDPEMALTRARKVLEGMVRDVFERRLQEPPGTQPLEGLLQRLFQNDHLPPLVNTYAHGIRELGNIGTHKSRLTVTAADVTISLSQLISVVEWYAQGAPGNPETGKKPAPKPPPEPFRKPLAIVPKGLRSFDSGDAKFFLELLPGSRDDKGLPESLRFWKHRIETTQELTFTVGVIYGPSGCGKSSLVKAGLLPKLGDRILSVYVEATAEDTEGRLVRGLRKRCPNLPSDLDLTGTLSALRQGKSLSKAQKVFIVLDQFEQWLHAKRAEEATELAEALRQCDGERVQCVVLVRDDYWMGLTRFMRDLRIKVLPGQNTTDVDLFDLRHSKKVLTAFGRAYGTLPESLSKEQESFLDQAVQGLSQDGRVICVQLALFAQMVQARPWTPATLKEAGGTEGVGLAFLEKMFTASRLRSHHQASKAVLKALLPDQGSDIKGNMQSHGKLLGASGYANRPKDFEELLRILDSEVRLITPTEPAGMDGNPITTEKHYQLTHDYLVPSLRDWLTRKQKETRQGRAELLLADRAAVWNARQENRQLPSLLQWSQIRRWTRKKTWTLPQQKMMRKASRHHAMRGTVVALLVVMAALAGQAIQHQVEDRRKATYADGLVQSLLNAKIAQVPAIIGEMAAYRTWTDPRLREENDKAAGNSSEKLHTSLALLPVDGSQVPYLYDRLLEAEPSEVPVIRDALAPYKDQLLGKLWAVAEAPKQSKDTQRLRAAAALATYQPESEKWTTTVTRDVVADLVLENTVYLLYWTDAFRPIKSSLLAPLGEVFRDQRPERSAQRSLATDLLANYAANDAHELANLLMDADERQFVVIYPKLKERGNEGLSLLAGEITKKLPPELPSSDKQREKLAQRQTNAAVALLRLGQADVVWPLLRHPYQPRKEVYGFSDPRVRSYIIHRLSPLGADPQAIVKRLDEEKDVSIRRALVLALGEFGPDRLSPAKQDQLLTSVLQIYRDDPDAGLHGAAEWLLRAWGQKAKIKDFEQGWTGDEERIPPDLFLSCVPVLPLRLVQRACVTQKRKDRAGQIQRQLTGDTIRGQGRWYVNSQRQTMVVIAGPVEFLMGSPLTEEGREGGPKGKVEMQHRKRIGRSFAIASKDVTVEQYQRFLRETNGQDLRSDTAKAYAPSEDCPINGVTWYEAAHYCNWLSIKEGIPENQWCYVRNAKGQYAEGMKLAPHYLSRSGYRLPSEAEWEYACRAGTVMSRYYGETEELLGKYAWYTKNSLARWMLPGPGEREPYRKPNDLGLFDMQGNALQWCQDHMAYYSPAPEGKASDDVEDTEDVLSDKSGRVLPGSSFLDGAVFVRTAIRVRYAPNNRDMGVGFRPARTFTP